MQRLIAANHKESDIYDYSLAKIAIFLEAIESEENRRLALDIHATALGAQGSSKSIQKRISELVKKNG